jgi:hypothetical protein
MQACCQRTAMAVYAAARGHRPPCAAGVHWVYDQAALLSKVRHEPEPPAEGGTPSREAYQKRMTEQVRAKRWVGWRVRRVRVCERRSK